MIGPYHPELETNCWIWTGGGHGDGYGRFAVSHSSTVYAHRWAYGSLVGPTDLTLDHLCHTHSDCPGGYDCEHRRCVNPLHLEPVTLAENVRRGNATSSVNARKTHCIRGHELAGANLLVQANGQRACLICRRANERRRYWAKKAADGS